MLKALRAEIPEAQASKRWGHVGVCEGYEGSSNSHGLSVATSQIDANGTIDGNRGIENKDILRLHVFMAA